MEISSLIKKKNKRDKIKLVTQKRSYLHCSNVVLVQIWLISAPTPYARLKILRVKIESNLKGIVERNSLSGKFRRARMA